MYSTITSLNSQFRRTLTVIFKTFREKSECLRHTNCNPEPEAIMKLMILICLAVFSISLVGQQSDTTGNLNQRKNQEQVKEQKRFGNQSGQEQLIGQTENDKNKKGKGKKSKDVFIDKDGDGIADSRAGGMGINKLRKRVRGGNHGSGSGGNGNGNGGNGGHR